ncbi:MAG: alanine--glyoxylate aminotransferase family protein [Bdellovibrionales bacterium]|nr:alanine--glyoxylate aminotransferase family protein [Bdellovibrionales bacterium]
MPDIKASLPLLMTPGPVPVPPSVLRALSAPIEHHRTPAFQKCFDRVIGALPGVFQTKNRAFMHVSTGTGGMESLLVNVLSPGDEVAAVVSGKFGERWADMAEAFGAKVERLDIEWGESVHLPTFTAWLEKRKPQIVLSQVCETSTGALHPIREMAQVVRRLHPECLFLVDAITALGAMPLPMDEWDIDGVVGGSQKAFMIPTGLSFVALSERAWARVQIAKCPRFYFDLRTENEANRRGETGFQAQFPSSRRWMSCSRKWPLSDSRFSTSASPLSRKRHAKRCRFLDFAFFPSTSSPSLTAILVPDSIDGQKWRSVLETKHGVVLMGGQDQMKGKLLRMGHMGFIRDTDLITAITAIVHAGREIGWECSDEKLAAALNTAREILSETPSPWSET